MPDIHTIISSSHMEYKAGASTAQESEKLLKSKHPVPDSYQIPRNPSTSQSAPIDWGTAEEAAFKVGANTTGATSRHSPLIPPQNFAQVTPDIYRSGFPELENFEYLRTLGLRSVLMLVPEECPNGNLTFMRQCDIRLFQVRIPGNKDTANISADNVTTALSIILDRDNYPILIHCNKGKHRTGCVIACFRKLQHWPLSSIFEEYHHHADPKARVADEEFIGQYDERPLSDIARRQEVISSKPALHAKLVTKDGGILPPLGPRITAATSSG